MNDSNDATEQKLKTFELVQGNQVKYSFLQMRGRERVISDSSWLSWSSGGKLNHAIEDEEDSQDILMTSNKD